MVVVCTGISSDIGDVAAPVAGFTLAVAGRSEDHASTPRGCALPHQRRRRRDGPQSPRSQAAARLLHRAARHPDDRGTPAAVPRGPSCRSSTSGAGTPTREGPGSYSTRCPCSSCARMSPSSRRTPGPRGPFRRRRRLPNRLEFGDRWREALWCGPWRAR